MKGPTSEPAWAGFEVVLTRPTSVGIAFLAPNHSVDADVTPSRGSIHHHNPAPDKQITAPTPIAICQLVVSSTLDPQKRRIHWLIHGVVIVASMPPKLPTVLQT